MQQYFIEESIQVGDLYQFHGAQEHHAKDVVRLDQEQVRLVSGGTAFLAQVVRQKNGLFARVTAADPQTNELPVQVTLAAALIRREKFELVLQKAAELGAVRIIPLLTSRCITRIGDEREEKARNRWQSILQEAAEQCKRNRIPTLAPVSHLADLARDTSACRLAAYEHAGMQAPLLSQAAAGKASCLIVIGPEGGFSEEEVQGMADVGIQPVSLGRRILRAETASIYALSVLSELAERSCR